jgi:hypothetical protein
MSANIGATAVAATAAEIEGFCRIDRRLPEKHDIERLRAFVAVACARVQELAHAAPCDQRERDGSGRDLQAPARRLENLGLRASTR